MEVPITAHPSQQTVSILEIDVMDLRVTVSGNKHGPVVQNFLTKWPWVFPIPDQKIIHIVDVLVKGDNPGVWSSRVFTPRSKYQPPVTFDDRYL